MSAKEQTTKLAGFLMENFPEEIGPDEGAADVAIRLLKEQVE